jgi:glycerol-3-phosphate acyltransferase PlsY
MNPRWFIPVVAYFLGSIPFGLLLVKLLRQGRDVRSEGSGNIGAANVTRVAGPGVGLATLLLDAGKGYLAVWLAARWSDGNVRWIMGAAVAAVLGHLFPIWLRFRGGRGVATGVGVCLLISGKAVLAAVAIWLLVVAFWRYVSLGSITAAAAMPLLVYLFYAPGHAPPFVVSLGIIAIAILVIWKHRPNIERLLSGTENRMKLGR